MCNNIIRSCQDDIQVIGVKSKIEFDKRIYWFLNISKPIKQSIKNGFAIFL